MRRVWSKCVLLSPYYRKEQINDRKQQAPSQPVSQSASQPVSQSASQPVSQSASQPNRDCGLGVKLLFLSFLTLTTNALAATTNAPLQKQQLSAPLQALIARQQAAEQQSFAQQAVAQQAATQQAPNQPQSEPSPTLKQEQQALQARQQSQSQQEEQPQQEHAFADSELYEGEDEADATPPPLPPSFALNLPTAVTVSLQNLNADELKRLRPTPTQTPIGVHRNLPTQTVQPVIVDDDSKLPLNPGSSVSSAQEGDTGLGAASSSGDKGKSTGNQGPARRNAIGGDGVRVREATHTNVQGAWQWVGNNSLWRLRIRSMAAQALRVHFKNFNVGAGRVWLHTSEGQAYGPYTGQGMYGDGDFWSDVVFSSELTIEYQPDPSQPVLLDTEAVPFNIYKISHLTTLNLGGRPNNAGTGEASAKSRDADSAGTAGSANDHQNKATRSAVAGDTGIRNTDANRGATLQSSYNTSVNNLQSKMSADQSSANYGGWLGAMAADVAEPNPDLPIRNLASCHLDVSCYSNWQQSASGVAQIIYKKNNAWYTCSGNLLNDKVEGTFIPYFLTAAHCVHTAAQARSVVAYWNYQSFSCNGYVPLIQYRPQTVGAELLATTGDHEEDDYTVADTTLLKLNKTSGRTYLGWSTGTPLLGASVVGIHHPDGEHKHISFGRISRSNRNLYYNVEWTRGTTESGSSGSPLFNTNRRVIGTQRGGSRDKKCVIGDRAIYTKLGVFYPQIQKYLYPNAPAEVGVSVRPASITRGQSVKVTWWSRNSRSVHLTATQENGDLVYDNVSVRKNKTITPTPTSTTTYCLVATNWVGRTAKDCATVKVIEPIIPTVSLSASPTSIIRGQSVTLKWSSTNAEILQLKCTDKNKTYNVRKNDSWTTSRFTSTTTCKITAQSLTRHKATKSVKITVRVNTARIISLTATPSSINRGQDTVIKWSSRNAVKGSLSVVDIIDGEISTWGMYYELSNGSFVYKDKIATGIWRIRKTSTSNEIDYSIDLRNASLTNGEIALLDMTSSKGIILELTDSAGQSTVETITVHVNDREESRVTPSITSFTASPTSIASGGEVNLRWQTKNAEHGRLTVNNYGRDTSWYITLRKNSFRIANTALRANTIERYIVSAHTILIDLRQSSLINLIRGGLSLGQLKSDRAPSTITFRLTLTSSTGHTVSRTRTVTIRASEPDPTKPALITSFTASPSEVRPNQKSTLTWSSSNASSAVIKYRGVQKNVATSGSLAVYPQRETTYSLTVRNASRSHTLSRVVSVRQPVTARIDRFTVSKNTIDYGDSVVLRWKTRGHRTHITHLGNVASSHSKTVSPTRTTTYTLTVTDINGAHVTSSRTVIVRPAISDFYAVRTTIPKGQSTRLRWVTKGATSVFLNLERVPLEDWRTVYPMWKTNIYELKASNAEGHEVKRRVTITVE